MSETVCQEADRLVSDDRQSSYGHPRDNFTRIGRMWGALLNIADIPPEKVALCLAAMKMSREAHKPKRDNRVDAIGYIKCADLILVREAEEAKR